MLSLYLGFSSGVILYGEGYHLTLKDGDFETTISNQVCNNLDKKDLKKEDNNLTSILDLLFNL